MFQGGAAQAALYLYCSTFVDFDSAADLDRTFNLLAEGGHVLMPLNNYGFSRRFGWLADRLGVSWQLNLA